MSLNIGSNVKSNLKAYRMSELKQWLDKMLHDHPGLITNQIEAECSLQEMSTKELDLVVKLITGAHNVGWSERRRTRLFKRKEAA